MPSAVSVDESGKFIRISLSGPIGDSDLVELSKTVRGLPALGSGIPVLYDCSAVSKIQVSAELIRSLGKAARADHNPVAFVAPNTTAFGLARMYQIVSDTGTDRVRVFSDMDQALAWLTHLS